MASEFTTIPLDEPITLEVRLGRGRLEIVMNDDATDATVQLTPHSPGGDLIDRITVELRGRKLIVSGPRQGGLADLVRGWLTKDAVDARIEVPAGTAFSIASASDEITVSGRSGDADIATAASRIALDEVAGNLRLRCGQTECRVGAVTGTVRVHGGSGSTYIGDVGGAFTGNLGRGEIELQAAHGPVRARSGHGAIRVLAGYADIDAATGYGAIDIGLPSGIAAQVDATTGLGEVVSPAPVDQRPAPGATKIGVRVRTGMGNISFHRVNDSGADDSGADDSGADGSGDVDSGDSNGAAA
jgi:hypothetical protein